MQREQGSSGSSQSWEGIKTVEDVHSPRTWRGKLKDVTEAWLPSVFRAFVCRSGVLKPPVTPVILVLQAAVESSGSDSADDTESD